MFGSRFGSSQKVEEIAASEAIQRIRSGRAQVVDVREDYEWNNGHVEGARHIPLGQLSAHVSELDRAREVLTVCASGSRSKVAAELLQKAGFTRVASIEGGMSSWKSRGYPVAQ